MSKINFTKAEQALSDALKENLLEKINLGESTKSAEAIEYYNLSGI